MSLKTGYLILYNLIQIVGQTWLLVSIALMSRVTPRKGIVPIREMYEAGARPLRIFLLIQWMEILHCLIKLSKGSPIASLIQVGFKSVIFFVFMDSYHADELVRNSKPAVFLLVVWSIADTIRYFFYLMTLLNADIYLIKWIRHSAWIPLYPLGITLEAIVVYESIPNFRKTGRFRVDLPNQWNMSFDPLILIHFYLYVGVLLGSYNMLSYMWSQRRRALTDKVEKTD